MPDLVLRRMTARNWQTFRNLEVQFPTHGLVFVSGRNETTSKLESNGSGKTAFGEALTRTLTGCSGRYSRLGDFSFGERGDLYVRVEATWRGEPLVVESGFKCRELSRTGEGLRFTWRGEQVERATLAETRADLQRLLGITPLITAWTLFLDGDRLRFNDLSEQEAVSLMLSALNQPPWDKYHTSAKRALQKFRQDQASATRLAEAARAAADRARQAAEQAREDLDHAAAEFEQRSMQFEAEVSEAEKIIEDIGAEIEKNTASRTSIKNKLKKIEKDSAGAIAAYEKRLSTLDDEIGAASDAYREARQAYALARERVRSITERRNELIGEDAVQKTCPTCGKPWSKSHSAKEVEAIDEKLTKASKTASKLKEAATQAESEVERVKEARMTLKRQKEAASESQKIQELSQQYEELESEFNRLNLRITRAKRDRESLGSGPDRNALTRAEAVLEERTRAVAHAEEVAEKAAVSAFDAAESVKIAAYWSTAFSPFGVPNLRLKEAVPALNSISRRLSTLLTGGALRLSYDTTRELRGGEERPKLVVKLDNILGSGRIEGTSKGEGGLANLIIAETLAEIGGTRKIMGWQWYDEVVKNVDPTARGNLMRYLQSAAERSRTLIFVVDHHPESERFADHRLVITKTMEGSVAEWA